MCHESLTCGGLHTAAGCRAWWRVSGDGYQLAAATAGSVACSHRTTEHWTTVLAVKPLVQLYHPTLLCERAWNPQWFSVLFSIITNILSTYLLNLFYIQTKIHTHINRDSKTARFLAHPVHINVVCNTLCINSINIPRRRARSTKYAKVIQSKINILLVGIYSI